VDRSTPTESAPDDAVDDNELPMSHLLSRVSKVFSEILNPSLHLTAEEDESKKWS
jgi:hypothetical protein